MLYGRQANWLDGPGSHLPAQCPVSIKLGGKSSCLFFFVVNTMTWHNIQPSLCTLSCTNNLDYMVKPHGQLVLVSSTPYNAYTPSLSTSWSWTALQGT